MAINQQPFSCLVLASVFGPSIPLVYNAILIGCTEAYRSIKF